MEVPVKILLVGHSVHDLQLMQDELQKGQVKYQVGIANTEVEFIQLIASFSPQIILADFSNEIFPGLRAFNLSQKIAADTAFLLVCNTVEEAYRIGVVNKAAVDYVAKDKLFTLNSKTERCLAEAKEKQLAKKTEQQLDIICNTVEDMIYMLHVEEGGRFKFVSANQVFLRNNGLLPEQVFNQYADDVISVASAGVSLNMYNECIKMKQPVEWEANFGSGGRKGHVRVTPIINSRRQCTSLIGTVHEITDQKTLMHSLEESNQRYDYVTRATSDAIWDWDIAADKVFWGDAYFHLFGRISEDESNIDVVYMRIHPDDIRELLADASEALKNEHQTNWQKEHRYLKSNGEYAFVSNKAVIVRNTEGKAVRVIGAMEDITEKKSMETALNTAASVARFGTWELDVIRNTLYWSSVIREILEPPDNYSPDLATGILFYKEGASRDLVTQKVNDAITKGLSFDIETEIVTPGGVEKWIRVLGTPEFENGICIKVTGSVQEIQTRKQAELTVIKMLEERSTILESIADAFFAMDENWIITYWNNHAEQIFEIDRAKIVGNNVWEMFPKRVGSKAHAQYSHAMKESVVTRFEDYNPELKKWFFISCYPAEKGGVAVYLKDITARKQAEFQMTELNANLQQQAAELAINNKALEASEKRFSDIFHLSPQPMWLFDEESLRFVQVNEAAVELYGYSVDEFMQMSLVDIKMPEDVIELQEEINIANKGDRKYNQHYKHRKKSGEKIDVEVYSTHINIGGKNLRSTIAIDVTEKNRQEYNIIKAIIKTQEDERYEVGSELHDNVCQILAGGQFFLQMLYDTLPANKIEYYNHCKENLQLALDETRNLSHRLAPAFFDDSTLEDAFKKMLENFSTGSNIRINLHFDQQLREQAITMEAQLNLYRILQEQISNIFKYANASMVEIHTLLEENKLIMTITDNGVGFNKAQIKPGIGFANMKRRAELFSGKFGVYSTQSNGCTIEVILPLEGIAVPVAGVHSPNR